MMFVAEIPQQTQSGGTLADTLELHRTQTINIKKSTKKKRVLQTQNPFYFKDYKEIEYFKR